MRSILQPVLVAVMVIAAGCGGSSGQQTPQPITASASKATVSPASLDETRYQEATVEQRPFNTTGEISVSGDVQLELEYQFQATAWTAVYTTDGPPPPVFAVLSVPQIRPEQVDIVVNPLKDQTPGQIATFVQTEYRGFEDVTHIQNQSVTMLDSDTTMQTFSASARAGDRSIQISLHLATTVHDDDVIVGIGIHPRALDETESIKSLLESIEH